MKMFPHTFSFFERVHAEDDVAKMALGRETINPVPRHDKARGMRPIKLDVECAVDVMLAARSSNTERTREQCRLEIIKTLPQESIDWDTVNWVLLWPFRTTRA